MLLTTAWTIGKKAPGTMLTNPSTSTTRRALTLALHTRHLPVIENNSALGTGLAQSLPFLRKPPQLTGCRRRPG